MHVVDDVIYGIWAAFWVGWLGAAIWSKPTRSRPTRWIGVRVVIFVIVVAVFRAGGIGGHLTTIDNPVLWGIGLGAFVAGLGLAVWARVYLGRNWGTPMSQKVDPELVTTGPYRSVRHPIYTGIILATVGTMVAVSWYWGIAVVLLGSAFIYSAVVEERNMAALFPDTYPAYRRSTKMLVPFVF